MTAQDRDKDRLFWVLCARALQRHGEGFPSTEEEIQAFESGYVPSEEDKAHFKELLPRILNRMRECSEREAGGLEEQLPAGGSARKPGDAVREGRTEALSAAARAADLDGLSPDLLKKIERIIEQSEEPSEQEEPERGNGTQDENRERATGPRSATGCTRIDDATQG